MTLGPDYEGTFRRLMESNVADVLDALRDREDWLMQKIENAAARYDLSREEIEAALLECRVLRFYFAKDPTRQSMHENAAAAFIRGLPGVTEFVQIRSAKKYIADGRVVDKRELRLMHADNIRVTHTKELDFEWVFGNRRFYAYHKHTTDAGGAQDNQYNDLKSFAREAAKNNIANAVFIAFCDGPYYLSRNGVAEMSRVDTLKNIATSVARGNSFAMQTRELPEFLRCGRFYLSTTTN